MYYKPELEKGCFCALVIHGNVYIQLVYDL